MGNYLSDALPRRQVGGPGDAPGFSNIGRWFGVFEANARNGPKYADKGCNQTPASVMLSGGDDVLSFMGMDRSGAAVD